MSRILIGKAASGNVHLDIDTFLRTRLLITSNSGGGKSFTIRRLAEQLFGKVQVILIDPEGEFATLREKFDYVLVGKGGETPADVRSASMLAHKLLELRASAVCDLYEMKPSERHRWVKLFLDSLIDAPKKLWHPVAVIIDEAHILAPEKGAGESEASESVIALATRGRKRGFACVLATQRLSKLRKDAAAELQNILVGPTFMDADRDRAADALGVARADKQAFFDKIKVLEPGNFYALGRAISLERVLVKIGPVETTHPESGSSKHAAEPPPAPQAIRAMLPKLSDLPRAAEEEARTVSDLKREVRELRINLKAAERGERKAAIPEKIVVDKRAENSLRVAIKEQERYIGAIRAGLDRLANRLQPIILNFPIEIEKSVAVFRAVVEKAPQLRQIEMLPLPSEKIERGRELVKRVAEKTYRNLSIPGESLRITADNGSEPSGIVAGALRMLSALAQWHPQGMKEGQMRAHAGLRKSGTFSTYLSRLRSANLIEQRDGSYYATDAGLDYCGERRVDMPTTTEEVVALWKPKLKGVGAQRMLDVLVNYGGEPIPKETLFVEAGFTSEKGSSGTFSTYLSRLRTARLARTFKDGTVAADKETLLL